MSSEWWQVRQLHHSVFQWSPGRWLHPHHRWSKSWDWMILALDQYVLQKHLQHNVAQYLPMSGHTISTVCQTHCKWKSVLITQKRVRHVHSTLSEIRLHCVFHWMTWHFATLKLAFVKFGRPCKPHARFLWIQRIFARGATFKRCRHECMSTPNSNVTCFHNALNSV